MEGLVTDKPPPIRVSYSCDNTIVAPHQSQKLIPWAIPQAFPLTNPPHSFLSYDILIVYPTFKPLLQSFRVSIQLFHGQPSKATSPTSSHILYSFINS